jgi:putative spermidine/putrescine transport system permease protein
MAPWRVLRGILCLLAAALLLAPLAVVVIVSFSAAPFLQFPPPGLSWRWYRNLASDPAWLDSVVVSLQILAMAAPLATGMGTAAAYALARGGIPGAGIIRGLLMAPIVVPGILVAAGLFGIFRGMGLNGTLMGLVIGHTVLTLPYVVATVGATLLGLDPRLESAAATLGAPPWTAFRRVTLPLLLPGVLSGLLFAAVVSFDELIVSLFVSTARVRPVPVQMWSNLRGDFDPTVAAIASVSFVVAVLALLLDALLRQRPRPDA